MIIKIDNHDYSIIWDQVYYFALSEYPNISYWELKKILSFIEYEKKYGRETKISCDNAQIMNMVHYAISNPENFINENIIVPSKITECTYCKQSGCLSDFVCHTATIENAKKILHSGKLLSAVNAFKTSGETLTKDPRNAAGDPADYFDYIMFSFGNCQAGDRLVMERTLGRNPTDDELQNNFKPGVRFYFRYNDIIKHPKYVFDGYHIAKIKDEMIISDYLYACIIPKEYEKQFTDLIPTNIFEKTFYLEQHNIGLLDWSEKVYNFINQL